LVARAAFVVGPALALVSCGSAEESLAPITVEGRRIATTFSIALAASLVVLLLVLGALAYVLTRFRASRPGEPSARLGHRTLEYAWTGGALLLIFGLFGYAMWTYASVEAGAPGQARVVEVVGHQWWWEYRYPDLNLVTANELYLPVGQPVELRLGSADVVHSFWVPRLGWKRDAIPGKTTVIRVTVAQAGTYDGACAEYCGAQHAWMRPRLVALPADRFDLWAQGQVALGPAPADDRTRRGFAIFFANTCVNCHAVRGTNANATVGPDLTHVGGRGTLGGGVLDNSADALRRWVADPQAIKPGVLMPAFPNLRDDELADLVAYLQSLK
jgi:cytochrome c oxidase subunit 2